jgi:hypothetical protein
LLWSEKKCTWAILNHFYAAQGPKNKENNRVNSKTIALFAHKHTAGRKVKVKERENGRFDHTSQSMVRLQRIARGARAFCARIHKSFGPMCLEMRADR